MNELEDVDTVGLMREASQRFMLSAGSIHGPSHWKAVFGNGMALADLHGCDRALVAVFSLGGLGLLQQNLANRP